MSFVSPNAFRDFDHVVRRNLRYVRTPEQESFLATVIRSSAARAVSMDASCITWRAQLGHDWRTIEQDGHSFEVPAAHPPKRMKPLREKASDGRANPKGIACLYLATNQATAALEVRPLIGSYISIAQFEIVRPVRLVNCSGEKTNVLDRFTKRTWTPDELERAVWSDINDAFSEPSERGDDSLDYVPTQVIAEAFKVNGFDGLAYKSSYGEDGFNVALFDIDAATQLNCQLSRVKRVSVVLSEEDNPYFVST